MARVEIDVPAPDFGVSDIEGRKVHLSDWKSLGPVVLVFNRGFF